MSGMMPGALEERPLIMANQSIYLDAFYDLSAGRGYTGMGSPLPISFVEMLAYFQIFNITSVEFRETFITHIRALDKAWMEERGKEKPKVQTPGTDS